MAQFNLPQNSKIEIGEYYKDKTNSKNLKKVKDKLDPRLYNGAILIGLNSPVVKSHGSTDYIGFSNSLKVCEKIVNGNLIDKIKYNIIT